MAKRLRREADRIDPSRVRRPHRRVGEAHLRRTLQSYARYYNESRVHRALNKDAPFHRVIKRLGAITSTPVLGGLIINISESSFRYTQALRSVPLSGQDRTGPRPSAGSETAHAQSVKGPQRSGRLQFYLAPGQSSRGRTDRQAVRARVLVLLRFLSGPLLPSFRRLPALIASFSRITKTALDGSCPIARTALDLFCAMLGTIVGHVALMFGARGGVYIVGGIAPRITEFMGRSEFRTGFEHKGRSPHRGRREQIR